MTVTEIRPRSAEQVTREAALQLGFAWHCTKSGTEGECDEAGNDRAEYAAHMKGHGRRSPRPVKMIRLKPTAPAARLPKLEVSPFKWLHWEQMHTEPGICSCGHTSGDHITWHGTEPDGGLLTTFRCSECNCAPEPGDLPPATHTTARRRGQFWSVGSSANHYWVLPFEPAPWEEGRAQPVELHVSSFIR
jgi:hypothetical protein